jgi:hypothetical protein
MSDLTTIHTKVLLNMLASCRCGFYDEPGDPTLDEIKAELAKRPHVPNKLEGKKLRQLAAKRKR